MMKKIIFAIYLLCVPVLGKTTEWVFIEQNSDGKVLLHKDSIIYEKDYIKAWTMYDLKVKLSSPKGGKYDSAKILTNYYCKSYKVASLQVMHYDGKSLIATHVFSPVIFHNVLPNTLDEAVFKKLCGIL